LEAEIVMHDLLGAVGRVKQAVVALLAAKRAAG
jgi:hypothetical protein